MGQLIGTMPTYKKLLRRNLKRMGVEERQLPMELRDSVVKQSRKGPLGVIKVRNYTGLESNAALTVVRKFEQNSGGLDDIAEKLEAVRPTLKKEEVQLLELLKSPTRKSLGHLIAETKSEPTRIMKAYAQGCIELGKVQAAIEAHKGLPAVVKDLVRHALDGEGVCMVCVGLGKVPKKKGQKDEDTPCPQCKGAGVSLISSEHKEFAVQKLLEITQQIQKGPMVQVNQQTVVTGGKGAGLFEKMLQASDEILYPARKEAPIDAEVVVKEVPKLTE